MIRVEQISPVEAQKLKEESITSYWALPLGMTFIFLILNWLFNEPWSTFLWLSGAVWGIHIAVRLLFYNKPRKFTNKLIRRGKIIHAAYLDNNPISKMNIRQHVDITLEAEPIPEPYPPHHIFTIWRTTQMAYHQQDDYIRHHYKELIGKEVELEYLPTNGAVIAFRLIPNL